MENEERTFDDLVNYHSNNILTSLIERGGKGLKNAVWLALNDTLQWKNKSK